MAEADFPSTPPRPFEGGEGYSHPGNYAAIIEARHLCDEIHGPFNSSSKCWHLCDDHFVSVVEWMLAGIALSRIAELCRTDFNLPPSKAPSKSSLSDFWQKFSPQWHIIRRRKTHEMVKTIGAEIEARPMPVAPVLVDEISQRAFEVMSQPNVSPHVLKTLVNAVLKIRDQEDRKEAREWDKEKFKEAARTKLEAGLSALQDELKGNPKARELFEQL